MSLQDYQTWCDLRELEHQLGLRWLTHHSDDARWQEYARLHDLPAPRVPPTNLADSSPESENCGLRANVVEAKATGAASGDGSSSNGGADLNHNQPNGSLSPSKLRC